MMDPNGSRIFQLQVELDVVRSEAGNLVLLLGVDIRKDRVFTLWVLRSALSAPHRDPTLEGWENLPEESVSAGPPASSRPACLS